MNSDKIAKISRGEVGKSHRSGSADQSGASREAGWRGQTPAESQPDPSLKLDTTQAGRPGGR